MPRTSNNFTSISIPTLSGGVGRQSPTKRKSSEVEDMENAFCTVERSLEKRNPLSQVVEVINGNLSNTSYLGVPHSVPPVTFMAGVGITALPTAFNTDNLYFHFLDLDGLNKYCIIINRAGYTWDPIPHSTFSASILVAGTPTPLEINLTAFLSVYRIEPTQWIKESIDTGPGSGWNRAIFEYLTYGNRLATPAAPVTHYMASTQVISTTTHSTADTFGSIDYGVGALLWNKLVPLGFMPDNSATELVNNSAVFRTNIPSNNFLHAGDNISFKIAEIDGFETPIGEDNTDLATAYWVNVRDHVTFDVNLVNNEIYEIGQSLPNFAAIPQYPYTIVKADIQDVNGFKAMRTLWHLYDNPFILTGDGSVLANYWTSDRGYLSYTGDGLERDNLSNELASYGMGKVYFARETYLNKPAGFYRIVKYKEHPYVQRTRCEGENTVYDYRRFPLHIFKSTDTGLWSVKHVDLAVKQSGASNANLGLLAVNRQEAIQSLTFWKNRLWVGTGHTIASSRSGDFFNFWMDDITMVVETDPIDMESSLGNFNKISHLVAFQDFLFVATSGSVQFEVRGGDSSIGISPMNVVLKPSSFFSSKGMTTPVRMANQLFFATPGYMYMYVGSSNFNEEYSIAMDMSAHAKGYLPLNPGVSTVSTTANTLFFADKDNTNVLFLFTNQIVGDKLIQNAFHKWILSPQDQIISIKAFEDNLFIVSRRALSEGGATALVVYYMTLSTISSTAPMLDWLCKIPTNRITYNGQTNQTTVLMPHYEPQPCQVVLHSEWDDTVNNNLQAYTRVDIASVSHGMHEGVMKTSLVLNGNWSYQLRGITRTFLPLWAGRVYTMRVELSTQFKRDVAAGLVYPGVLNLKKITLRHFNTGQYKVEITRNNRESTVVESEPVSYGDISDALGSLRVEKQGELCVKVLSYSDRCKITILSDYPTPCNIANIDIIASSRPGDTGVQK